MDDDPPADDRVLPKHGDGPGGEPLRTFPTRIGLYVAHIAHMPRIRNLPAVVLVQWVKVLAETLTAVRSVAEGVYVPSVLLVRLQVLRHEQDIHRQVGAVLGQDQDRSKCGRRGVLSGQEGEGIFGILTAQEQHRQQTEHSKKNTAAHTNLNLLYK